MNLAVFSDIHGNIYSLEKALEKMQAYRPDGYLFLGDMAGYYYYQNECISLLNNLPNLISIKGNHDEYFINSLKDKKYLKELDTKYGRAYTMLHQSITAESLDFFNNLSTCEKNKLYEAYHGSPNNYLQEYIYPDTDIKFDTRVPIVFLGHTHYPMKKEVNDTLILNPGSIGQPRDYNQGSFIIVDTEDKKVENIRYEYNKKSLIDTVIASNDNKYLIDILKREIDEKN